MTPLGGRERFMIVRRAATSACYGFVLTAAGRRRAQSDRMELSVTTSVPGQVRSLHVSHRAGRRAQPQPDPQT